MDRWRKAIDLAAKLGLVRADVAARAIERTSAEGDGALTTAIVGGWLSLSPEKIAALLILARDLPSESTVEQASERFRSTVEAFGALAGDMIADPPLAPTMRVLEGTPAQRLDSSGTGVPAAPPWVAPPATESWLVDSPLLPVDLGRYRILRELGRGGMGIVYQAHDTDLGRDVALKVLLVEGRVHEGAIERFELEARSAAQLSHPNIVPIHDVGRLPGVRRIPFYTMDLLQGEDMAHAIAAGSVTQRTALEVTRQIALALAHAHSRRVLHRDVKPQNVFLRKEPLLDPPERPREAVPPEVHALLLDFGLAKLAEHELPSCEDDSDDAMNSFALTRTGQLLGTPAYMSPEQVRGMRDIDPRADVYGLGAALYHALTGHVPFDAPTLAEILIAVLRRDPTPPRRHNPTIDAEAEWLCLKCLQKRPEDRYQSASELAEECQRLLRRGVVEEARVSVEKDHQQRLVSLDWVGSTLQSHNTRETILKEAGSYASTMLKCVKVSVVLLDPDGKMGSIAWSMGIDRETARQVRVKPGEGPCGRVLANGRPICSDEFISVPMWQSSRDVLHEKRLVGVFNAANKLRGASFTKDDLSFLQILATQTGISLESAALHETATVDGLTRLRTRDHFDAALEAAVQQSRMGATPLTLLMIEIDGFKEVVIRLGRLEGDSRLREVASVIKSKIGPEDIACRYEGPVLAVILRNSDSVQGRAVATLIRRAVPLCPRCSGDSTLVSTVSIGSSSLWASETGEVLATRTYAALYEAQQTARDSIVLK